MEGIREIERFLKDRLAIDLLRTPVQRLNLLINGDRKDAAAVNQEFLYWLTGRRRPQRPFFGFLNYYDAHTPYQLPPGRIRRFGTEPGDTRDSDMIENWWPLDKTGISSQDVALASDAYDDCVADLDEQLGRLFDERTGGRFSKQPGSSSRRPR